MQSNIHKHFDTPKKHTAMKKYFLLLFLLFFSIYSFGQIKESQKIDSVFAKWNNKYAPGCTIGIIKDHKLIYTKGYGLANMEYNIPNSESSVFRIASTSKQFTAACILLLVEKDKLSLDNNLKKIFPEFPEYAKKIKIRHLLNHTSGIRDYLQIAYLKGLNDDDYYTDDNVMKWLVNQSNLNFVSGEEYLYSNSGYWLLGQIVKKIAGINIAEFARKEIFIPLGMNNTHFHNDHTQIVKNRASGYVLDNNGNYKISMTTLDMIGDGGIFTTINDIKKWDDSYYKSKILSREFWNMMTEQGILNNGKIIDYASGLRISKYKGLKTIKHGGGFVGFRAELLRFPDQKLSIAIFANRDDINPSSIAYKIADILLKDKFTENIFKRDKKNKIDNPEGKFKLSQLSGDYELSPGFIAKFFIKNDSLKLFQRWDKSNHDLKRLSNNIFQISGNEYVSFSFSNLENGFTQTLKVMEGSRKTITTTRKKEIDITRINLKDYLGVYYSKELDVNYSFEIENQTLVLRIENKKSTIKSTINNIDEFSTNLGLVRFKRKNSLIYGLELDSGRVINLIFKKITDTNKNYN